MAEAADGGGLVINQVIYSELAAGHASREEVDAIYSSDRFRREGVPWDAAYAAGLAFLAYRRRGGVLRRDFGFLPAALADGIGKLLQQWNRVFPTDTGIRNTLTIG